jgi:hypothetical protein
MPTSFVVCRAPGELLLGLCAEDFVEAVAVLFPRFPDLQSQGKQETPE